MLDRPVAHHAPKQSLLENEQSLSDRDQRQSDADQARSDADQTNSDRDQASSDRDQAASDRDLASGVVDARTHATSRDVRRLGTQRRRQATAQRLDTARTRADVAGARAAGAGARHARSQKPTAIAAGSPTRAAVDHQRDVYARRRADPENVAALRHLTIELAADAGATPDQLADVALAVSAALMNAVRYGYPDCGTPGDMSVRATAADHVLEIEVSDEGIGMPASTADHDREMGHALIGQVTDTFTVDTERSWGVRVHMTFELG